MYKNNQYAHDDAIYSGCPGPGEDGGDVGDVALPAVVDPFEHLICREFEIQFIIFVLFFFLFSLDWRDV